MGNIGEEGKGIKFDKNVKRKIKCWLFWLMGVSK